LCLLKLISVSSYLKCNIYSLNALYFCTLCLHKFTLGFVFHILADSFLFCAKYCLALLSFKLASHHNLFSLLLHLYIFCTTCVCNPTENADTPPIHPLTKNTTMGTWHFCHGHSQCTWSQPIDWSNSVIATIIPLLTT
jgi:hypothetical protein